MESKESTLKNIFSRFLVICGFLMFIFITIFSYRNEMAIYSSKTVLILEVLITVCVIAVLSFLVNRYLSAKTFLIILALIGIGIRLLWIFNEKTPPFSDFSLMYEAAKKAANGDFSFISDDYYSSWAYQLGFTYYEAILIKVFGNHLSVLKLFNIFFNTGTSVIIYLLAKKIFNEYSARTAALLYTFYIPNILYCSVLTDQHISTFFFFLGIYLFVTRGLTSRYGWAFTGLMLGIGNIMRPAGGFFLLGVCVFVFLYKMLQFKKEESFKPTLKLVGIIATYFLVMQITSMSLLNAGLAKVSLSNQAPYWKFVIGLNYDSVGGWNLPDVQYLNQFKLGKDRNNASIDLIKERLQDKKKVAKLLGMKVVKFWTNPDDAPMWSLINLNKPNLQQELTKYERLMYIAFSLFAIGTIELFKRNYELVPLLYILLGGYAIIHLLVEVQTRYRFDILPAFFIMIGYGVFATKETAKNLLINRRS